MMITSSCFHLTIMLLVVALEPKDRSLHTVKSSAMDACKVRGLLWRIRVVYIALWLGLCLFCIIALSYVVQ